MRRVRTIPYSATARPDTGLTNARLAMWLFLASEAMLFGALFSSYVLLRTGAVAWPRQGDILDVPLAAINTVVLLASSGAMWTATRTVNAAAQRRALALTVLLGLLFLGLKGVEWAGELGRGLRPADSNFLGLYFLLTGLHALHVLGGVLASGWLLSTAASAMRRDPALFVTRVRVAGLYWHFVDAIWIVLFVVLYLT